MKTLRTPFLLALAGLLIAGSVAADLTPKSLTLGSDGELLELRAGTYGELFPEGDESAVDSPVLALDVVNEAGRARLLVPGTESQAVERSAQLVHDEAVGVSYLLWESVVNGIHPRLEIRSFDGTSWSDAQTIHGSIFSSKGEPQLVVTRDGDASIERTVLHVLWWEQAGIRVAKRYAPLVIENGVFAEDQPIIDLSLAFGSTKDPSRLSSAFESLLRVQQGPNAGTLVAGFLDTDGSLTSIRLDSVPLVLSHLADHVTTAVASLAENATDDEVLTAVQGALADFDSSLHPAVLALIEIELGQLLADLPAGGRAWGLAEKARGQIVWIGARMKSHGLAEQSELDVLSIEGRTGSHHVKLTRLGQWDEPETGAAPSLYLSRDGGDALVCWLAEDGHSMQYRETRPDATWSEVRHLPLRDGVDLEAAHELLRLNVFDR
ncbi:MAG: hypothetical protein AAGE94_01565 [Acidobacteriota bacterium]